MADIVRGVRYCLKFHKGQFQDLRCSIFSYAVCFTVLRTLILQIMPTILHHICARKSIEFVVNNSEQSSSILFEWLNNNYMKLNTGQSHLLLSGNSRSTTTIDGRWASNQVQQLILTLLLKTANVPCSGVPGFIVCRKKRNKNT